MVNDADKFAKAWRKQTTKQAGEYRVAAELCRRGMMATTFAGNMPGFDVLAVRPDSKSFYVQVKASVTPGWQCGCNGDFVQIGEREGVSVIEGKTTPLLPDLIWVFVTLDSTGDRFYVLRHSDLHDIVHEKCVAYFARRPKIRPPSEPADISVSELASYLDQWDDVFGLSQ